MKQLWLQAAVVVLLLAASGFIVAEEGSTERTAEITGTPAIVVLDNCDPDFKGDGPHGDSLRLLGAHGEELHVLPGFNNSGTVGGVHCIALDRKRRRIYVCDSVPGNIIAVNLNGQVKLRVPNVNAGAIALDPETGNLWCEVGDFISRMTTIVLDSEGKEVASYPFGGVDIAFERQTGAFWIVGDEVIKVNREGHVLLKRPLPAGKREPDHPAILNGRNWAAVSVATERRAHGGAWVAVRDHRDVPGSLNRLIRFDEKGRATVLVELGQDDPFAVAIDAGGNVWVADRGRRLLCFSGDGEPLRALPIKAMALAAAEEDDHLWVATPGEILRLDPQGEIEVTHELGRPSSQSWLGAF